MLSASLATLILAIAAPALAQTTASGSESASYTTIPGPTSTTVLGIASGGALDTNAVRPAVTSTPVPEGQLANGADMTINIVNSFGVPLSIMYGSNAGAPTPVGNPGSGTLTSTTSVVFPSDWAGRITIGKNYDPAGSKIEASLSSPDYLADVDISYVDGYSIPITCSCAGVVVTGCNVPLFNDGITCANEGAGPVCYNPEQGVPDGPASPFFAPCAGAAYTYPNDNAANSYGQCASGVIDCCVGPQCPAPARQPSKRRIEGSERRSAARAH